MRKYIQLAIEYYQLTCIGKKYKLKRSIGFMSKTTALHVHHAFFYISLMITARLRGEISQCDVLWRTWTYDDRFSFLSLNMDKALTADFSAVYTPSFLDVIRQSRFDRRDSPERLPSSAVFYLEYPTLMIA